MRRNLLVITALLSSACGHSFELKAPQSFLELDEENGYAARMTSADGTVISVREIENDPEGNLSFWAQAIRDRLRLAGGYELLEEKRIRAATGQQGTQMRFGREEGSRPYLYWLTLFVTHDHIFIVEAGGRREVFERARPQLERSIAAFRIDD